MLKKAKEKKMAIAKSEFNKWYKQHYGTDYNAGTKGTGLVRPENMKDSDWNYGNQLYRYLEQSEADEAKRKEAIGAKESYYKEAQDALAKNYMNAQSVLDTGKKSQQQAASISHDKLMKYLPTQLKAQGLDGVGVSQTAILDANARLASDMGKIENQYSADVAELEASKSDDMNALLKYKSDDIDEINAKYDAFERERDNGVNAASYTYDTERVREDEAQKTATFETESINLENLYADKMKDGNLSQDEYNELKKYVEDIKDSVGESNYKKLEAVLKGYENSVAKVNKLAGAEVQKTDIYEGNSYELKEYGVGDNLEIVHNGKKYDVKTVSAAPSSLGLDSYGSNGDVAEINGELYACLPVRNGSQWFKLGKWGGLNNYQSFKDAYGIK